jgi:signal transduction histidine kinase
VTITVQNIPDEVLEILMVATLCLLGTGAGVATLTERFGRIPVPHAAADTAALLARLVELGLVVVSGSANGEPRYMLTTLGRQYVDTLPGDGHTVSAGLQDLEHLRTDFMSTIAHELRTPLTAVRTSIDLLRDPSITPDPDIQTRLLDNIARSAELMQGLVNDLLDLTRFRAGQIQLDAQRFDARALTVDAAVAITSLVESRGQMLQVSTPAEPVWITADRRRLERVLLNLLSNAQKFSPDGAPIGLTLVVGEREISWVVTDHGPGISPEDQRYLFERFFTGKATLTVREAGAGLGLPIALTIVQEHGGTITVDSAVERGSTFTVTIPRYTTHEADDE